MNLLAVFAFIAGCFYGHGFWYFLIWFICVVIAEAHKESLEMSREDFYG